MSEPWAGRKMADTETPHVEGFTDRGKRGAVFDRDWTKGSITRNLLSLSWPIMISDGLRTVGPTIDMIWMGKLGVASLAGLGVASMAVLLVTLGIMGIHTGMRAMVARFVGAGDAEGTNQVAQQALVISGAYAIFMAAIGILLAEPIISLLGVEADVVTEAAAYVRIVFAGSAAMSFGMMAEGIMQASGDAVTPMRISILYRVVHMVFCPFLVFGWWVFPRMGVSGAAITNVVSQSLGMVLGLLVLFTGRSRLRLTLRNFRLDLNIIWRMVRIGIPASIMMAERVFGRLAFVRLVAPFGTLAVAGHAVVERIEVLLTTPGFGFGRAGGVLTGHNLGAQQPGRAERSSWLGVGFVEGIMVIFAIVILLWPASVIRIFSPEPGVVEIASAFLRILIVGLFAIGFDVVLQNCLLGAGDTLPPMLFTLLTMCVVPVPLALLLPEVANLGVYGVRWAIVAGMVLGAVAQIIYFRLGRWKRKRV